MAHPQFSVRCLMLCGLGLAGQLLFAQERLSREQERFFESKIRPVLVEHCYDCHASDAEEAGGELLLDSKSGILQGGVSGPAIVTGRPRSSLLLLAMQQTDVELMMPPKDHGPKLPDEVIADFERWIQMGAPDPRTSTRSAPVQSNSGEDDSGEASRSSGKDWWVLRPTEPVDIPGVGDETWPQRSLDFFVLSGLEEVELAPSPPADRLTLVRRLAMDLAGLPPTVKQLQAYALDEDPQPIEGLVDELLSSQHFGERMGRHWLDVARFAESTGKDINVAYPNAWRYRDYVIDAFNSDLPYDHFLRAQIAGDLLPHQNEAEAGRLKIATGFLAIGAKGLNERNPRQFAADTADEQIDAVSQAFLATTIACARCHDHKFDPITQRDYTAVAGIFLSTNTHYGTTGGVGGQNVSTLIDLPSTFEVAKSNRRSMTSNPQQIQERIAQLEDELQEYRRKRVAGDNDVATAGQALRSRQQLVRLQTELATLDDDGSTKPLAMGATDKSPPRSNFFDRARRDRRPFANNNSNNNPRLAMFASTIVDSPLLIRGEIDKPGEVVPRGLPQTLAGDFATEIPRTDSGRLQLANWIASPGNPLTARVMANRVWSWMIGEGIVSSVDNFGTSGALPSNQALLDHLANELVASDWSIKHLVKQIVLSSTYRQASDHREEAFLIDPDNRLVWRANRKAVDAETLRDILLVASGKLADERPVGSLIAQAGDGPIGVRRGVGLSETAIVKANPPHRSVYLPIARNVLPESLELFDFADNSAVNGARDLTITPSQALYWMNNEQVAEYCSAIAKRWMPQLPSRQISSRGGRNVTGPRPSEMRQQFEQSLTDLTLSLLARPPLPAEKQSIAQFMMEGRRSDDSMEVIWTGITRALVSSGDFRFVR